MKKILLTTLIIAIGFGGCSDTTTQLPKYTVAKDKVTLSVLFTDTKWDGKTVPKDEVCSDYHQGGGRSPAILILNLPKKTNYVMFSFSDDTFKQMGNGGHGIIGYEVESNNSTGSIPSIKGETFQLPIKGITSLQKHQGEQFGKVAGAYLPPCSGGRGNLYTMQIKALQKPSGKEKNYTLLGDVNMSMGRY